MIFKLFGELVFVDFKGFYRTRYRSEKCKYRAHSNFTI